MIRQTPGVFTFLDLVFTLVGCLAQSLLTLFAWLPRRLKLFAIKLPLLALEIRCLRLKMLGCKFVEKSDSNHAFPYFISHLRLRFFLLVKSMRFIAVFNPRGGLLISFEKFATGILSCNRTPVLAPHRLIIISYFLCSPSFLEF
jgi:hypothetical protein